MLGGDTLGVHSICCDQNAVTPLGQHRLHQCADGCLVFDDEDYLIAADNRAGVHGVDKQRLYQSGGASTSRGGNTLNDVPW
jgi:hypothetical protein